MSEDAVFAPVRSQTAFEETVERLGTAIKLGLLAPGTRLPAERELCRKLGIARSTLRQALLALGQTGHLQATRGRRGGTFVADPQPPSERPSEELLGQWQRGLRQPHGARGRRRGARRRARRRVALRRARARSPTRWTASSRTTRPTARATCASTSRSPSAPGSARLIAAETAAQGEMTALISMISHPAAVLRASNEQHRRLVRALRSHDGTRAARVMSEHVEGTAHILAGFLPSRG